MQPTLPYWYRLRQGKAEPAGENVVRLTAPNLPEAFLAVRQGANQLWSGALRKAADGPDVAATDPKYDNPVDAWYAAFELFRNEVVI